MILPPMQKIPPPVPPYKKEKDNIEFPNHYELLGINTIEFIASSLTKEEWKGFCLGTVLKYRIRAGKKDALQQDIDKANRIERFHDELKHLCREER